MDGDAFACQQFAVECVNLRNHARIAEDIGAQRRGGLSPVDSAGEDGAAQTGAAGIPHLPGRAGAHGAGLRRGRGRPTGAGDSFGAAFTVAILEGMEFGATGRFANARPSGDVSGEKMTIATRMVAVAA